MPGDYNARTESGEQAGKWVGSGRHTFSAMVNTLAG